MVLDEHGLAHCLGYCGRSRQTSGLSNETWSSCGACPWGTRTSPSSFCLPCENALPAYDWMFLLFVALIPVLIQFKLIHSARKYCRRAAFQITENISVIMENVMASMITVLLYPPRFTFFLNSCDKSTLREWYPMLNNPTLGHSKTIKCSSEIVYPLYSLPFVHYLVLIVTVLIVRTFLYCVFIHKTLNGTPYFKTLIVLPFLAFLHACFAGVIYYSYPWIALGASLMLLVHHLAVQEKTTVSELIARVSSSNFHITFLLITLILLAFSLTAIIIPLTFAYRWFLLCLVPVPMTLYLIIMPFTHPSQISKYK